MRTKMSGLVCACLLLLALVAPSTWGDVTPEIQGRILEDVKYLASDELEGRGVGTKGLDLAADHIRNQFQKSGLNVTSVKGGAFQEFQMTTKTNLGSPNKLVFTDTTGKARELTLGTEFTPMSFGGAGTVAGEIVFCGYGIDAPDQKYNDFDGVDLKGKIALIMRREPRQSHPQGNFTGQPHGVSVHSSLTSKLSQATGRGATAVIFVDDPFSARDALKKSRETLLKQYADLTNKTESFLAIPADQAEMREKTHKQLQETIKVIRDQEKLIQQGEPDTLTRFGYGGGDGSRSTPVLQIKRSVADELLKASLKTDLATLEAQIDQDLKPRSQVVTGSTASLQVSIDRVQATVKNVIGVLEGEGPLAQETVVVGAHYDHVGRGGAGSLAPGSSEIHNGADDNASGTALLMELSRRIGSRGTKLPRRVVFIAFTAEESGLIGSARYCQEPVFPLEQTVAMLNLDMVGRITDNKVTVFGTDTSPVWKTWLPDLGKKNKLDLAFKPEGFGPSDHSSFYAKKIPVLHFFTGTHNDYHRPSDDWDKINTLGMNHLADLMEELLLKTIEVPERPAYVAVQGNANPLRDAGRRPYFGSIPDFGSELPGYLLQGVSPGSPAEKGGLKGGDRIIQLGDKKVDNLEDFDLALRRHMAGETVKVTVVRNGANVEVMVTLEKPRE